MDFKSEGLKSNYSILIPNKYFKSNLYADFIILFIAMNYIMYIVHIPRRKLYVFFLFDSKVVGSYFSYILEK